MGIEEQIDKLIDLGEDIKSRLDRLVELATDHFADANKMVAEEPPKKWRILEPGEVVCSSDRVKAKTSPPSDPPDGLGWRPVDASVGTSVCEDDPCVFARPVADDPAKQPEPEHPPDPGEGYRILSKDPPEDLSPGDEYFGMWDGLWRASRDASEGIREQRETRWYRRKIESPKPPEPEYREPVLPADAGKRCEFSISGKTWDTLELVGWNDNPEGWPWKSRLSNNEITCWKQCRIKKDA